MVRMELIFQIDAQRVADRVGILPSRVAGPQLVVLHQHLQIVQLHLPQRAIGSSQLRPAHLDAELLDRV